MLVPMRMPVLVLVLVLGQQESLSCFTVSSCVDRTQHPRHATFDYEHEHRFTEHEHGAAKTDTLYQPLQAPKTPLKHCFNHFYDLFKSVEIEPTHAALIDSVEQEFER